MLRILIGQRAWLRPTSADPFDRDKDGILYDEILSEEAMREDNKERYLLSCEARVQQLIVEVPSS